VAGRCAPGLMAESSVAGGDETAVVVMGRELLLYDEAGPAGLAYADCLRRSVT